MAILCAQGFLKAPGDALWRAAECEHPRTRMPGGAVVIMMGAAAGGRRGGRGYSPHFSLSALAMATPMSKHS